MLDCGRVKASEFCPGIGDYLITRDLLLTEEILHHCVLSKPKP